MKWGIVTAICCCLLAGCTTPSSPKEALPLPQTMPAPKVAGPLLKLDYGRGKAAENPIAVFMYFVPLISPELVSIQENPGNTQRAKVLPLTRRFAGDAFFASCEFIISGAGRQENIFDLTEIIKRARKTLQAGGTVEKQLAYINVTGPGHGAVEIEGTITNRALLVTSVRLRFQGFGQASPVTIGLEDLRLVDGKPRAQNELVAQVDSLTFKRSQGPPKMEVSLGSVKRKDAGNGLWQRFVGNVTGAAANLFIKPLTVEATGHKAMLDFGLALATEQPSFIFPQARNLKQAITTE